MTNFQNCALLEGIVTSTNEDGGTSISPMGPRVDWPTTSLLLRPFKSSRTFQNLRRTERGILHVTDDVLLIARAAIGRLPASTPLVAGPPNFPQRLDDCVRWYAFEVQSIDDTNDRTEMVCRVVDEGRVRDFFGLNRAQHAVIEASILVTRLHLLSIEKVLDDFARYAELIEKTAGNRERQAYAELQQYLNDRLGDAETKTMLDS